MFITIITIINIIINMYIWHIHVCICMMLSSSFSWASSSPDSPHPFSGSHADYNNFCTLFFFPVLVWNVRVSSIRTNICYFYNLDVDTFYPIPVSFCLCTCTEFKDKSRNGMQFVNEVLVLIRLLRENILREESS